MILDASCTCSTVALAFFLQLKYIEKIYPRYVSKKNIFTFCFQNFTPETIPQRKKLYNLQTILKFSFSVFH